MLLWARDTRSSVRGREPETTSMASAAHSPLWVVTARLRKRPRLDSVPGGRLSSLQLLMASSSTFSRPWKKNESKVSLRKTIQNLKITIKKVSLHYSNNTKQSNGRMCVCTCVIERLYDHLGIIIDYDSTRNDGLMVIDRTLEHPLQCWHRSAINEILLTLCLHHNYGSRPSAIETTELQWKSRCNHH